MVVARRNRVVMISHWFWISLSYAWFGATGSCAFAPFHIDLTLTRRRHCHVENYGRSFHPLRSASSAEDEEGEMRSNNNPSPTLNPPWREICEVPIAVETQEQFDSIPLAKRLAIVSRVSVLHLTLLSCFGPLIVRGALRSALPASAWSTMPLTPFVAALFTIDGLSWHATHNLLNDWQDLDDDDSVEDSFRLAYGCHALKQGFLKKSSFLGIMALVGLPGALLTYVFRKTVLAPAAVYGIIALFFYTIVFKPLSLGEILIYFVWGPLMAGFGRLAAGALWAGPATLFYDPAVIIFGLAGFSLIMGKHTDKITRSRKRTLPKVLGSSKALWGCAATIVAPHIVLAVTLIRERIFCPTAAPTLPLSSMLAFLTLFREAPAALKVFRLGPLVDNNTPSLPRGTVIKGTIIDADVDRAWPLWFVAFCGWHAITFAYLLVFGCATEWIGRALWRAVMV